MCRVYRCPLSSPILAPRLAARALNRNEAARAAEGLRVLSLVPQRVDGIEARCLSGRIEAKEDADGGRKEEPAADRRQ